MLTRTKSIRRALGPVLALILLAGSAGAASAATTPGGNQIQPNAVPGSDVVLKAGIVGPSGGGAQTSNLTITWQAPANSVFSSNLVGWSQATGGNPFGAVSWDNTCVLSNANTTLTCPARSYTVPAASGGFVSYLQLHAQVTVDPAAPYDSTFQNTVSWVSNNGQISTGSSNPGFSTPAAPPVPMIDLTVGLSLGAVALGAGALAVGRRKRVRAAA